MKIKYCAACWGTGKVPDFWDNDKEVICPHCNGTGKESTMTNEEWRKTCSTEEFAKWMFDIIGFCLNYETYPDKNKYKDLMGTAEDIERWLKQLHTNEEG